MEKGIIVMRTRNLVVIGIFFLLGIVFTVGGICIIGKYFFKGWNERIDVKEARAEEKSARDRKEKISVLKSVNSDDFRVKEILEEIARKKCSKRNWSSDLTKLIAGAPAECVKLERWHAGESDEDLEQIERYEAEYLGLFKKFEMQRKKLFARRNEISDEFVQLEKQRDEILTRMEPISQKSKALSVQCERTLERFHAATEEAKIAPKFRQYIPANEAVKYKKQLDALRGEVANLEATGAAIQKELSDVSEKIKHAEETRCAIWDDIAATNKNLTLCRKALELTQACLVATREIIDLKAKILEIEETRGDKKTI